MLKCDDCRKLVKKEDTIKLIVIDKKAFRILCKSCFRGAKVIKI